jgi:hypothetical protein
MTAHRIARALLTAGFCALHVPALAGDSPGHEGMKAKEPANPQFEMIRGLAGEWKGTARAPGDPKTFPTVASIRLVSAGSAVMLVTDPGTPHEMVTMFHLDDGAPMATHYCAAMNQPRLRASRTAEPGKLIFEFTDGTNLKSHPGRMERLVLSFPDADHHVQEWTFLDGGKSSTMIFEMARKS